MAVAEESLLAKHQELISAEQPAMRVECLQDVRRWLTTDEVVHSNLDTGPLNEAVAVLSRSPRPRQEEVRPLQSKWGVTQTKKGKIRPLAEVISEFERKVVVAAQKFQQQLASNPALQTQCAASSSGQTTCPKSASPRQC